MNKIARIAIFIYQYFIKSGPMRVAILLYRYLKSIGHDPIFVYYEGGKLADQEDFPNEIFKEVKIQHSFFSKLMILRPEFDILYYFIKNAKKFDLILDHYIHRPSFPALYNLFIPTIQYLYAVYKCSLDCVRYIKCKEIHHSLKQIIVCTFYILFEKLILKIIHPNTLVCLSNKTKSELKKYYNLESIYVFGPTNKTFILNNINLKNIEKNFVLLTGRFDPFKKFELALPFLKNYRVAIVGSTLSFTNKYSIEYEKYLKQKFDYVEFYFNLKDEELKTFYMKADIYIFTNWEEPFGLTAIEGLGSGNLTIIPKDSAISIFIEHGVNGFLVEKDFSNLSSILKEISELSFDETEKIRLNAINTAKMINNFFYRRYYGVIRYILNKYTKKLL